MAGILDELLAICRKTQSFGLTLSAILTEQDVSQKELAWRIQRSRSDVSRLINDQLPDKFEMREVERIAKALVCDDRQFAQMVRSFACYILRQRGLW